MDTKAKSQFRLLFPCYFSFFVNGAMVLLVGAILPYIIEEAGINYSVAGGFPKTSGYDGDNLRVTNIVGIQNGDFLKECPKCGRAKCSEQFGLRTTVNRDQSECTDCRGEY